MQRTKTSLNKAAGSGRFIPCKRRSSHVAQLEEHEQPFMLSELYNFRLAPSAGTVVLAAFKTTSFLH